eukprot:1973378-Pyramimonas_sp.AAC.1
MFWRVLPWGRSEMICLGVLEGPDPFRFITKSGVYRRHRIHHHRACPGPSGALARCACPSARGHE